MVKERMDLLELLRKGGMDGDVDFLREALKVLVEGIMDAEVSSRIGAEYGERSPERVTQRNGYRSSGPHHQDSGEAKIRESTAGVSRKPSSDGKARGCSSKQLSGLTAWNT